MLPASLVNAQANPNDFNATRGGDVADIDDAIDDSIEAPAVSAAGDIAIIGINTDGDDDIAFVALVDIPASTTIYFSDNEWGGAAFVDSNEGVVQWDSPASVVTAGTVVVMTDMDSSSNPSFGANIGTLSMPDATFNMSSAGDIVYAYLGTGPSTPTTFLFAFSTDSTQFADNGGTLTGTGLTLGTDALEFAVGGGWGDGYDGLAYNGTRSGTQAALLAEIADIDFLTGTWTGDASNGENLLPFNSSAFTVTTGGPCASYVFPYTVPAGDAADLIQAIDCANSNAGADVINLTNSTYTLTDAIVTGAGGPFNTGFGDNGLPVIIDDLTINGNGATIERDLAAADFRMMQVDNSITATIDDVTLNNGFTNNSGGAIRVEFGSTFYVLNSTLSGNAGALGSSSGGALVNSGTLYVINSIISGNSAEFGGAIGNSGTLVVTNSTLAGNAANQAGGGIDSNGTTLVQNSIVHSNSAPFGAALSDFGLGLFTVRDSLYEAGGLGGTIDTTDPGNIPGGTPDFVSVVPATIGNPTTAGDYNINMGSDAIDAADNTADPDDAGAVYSDMSVDFANDIDGDPRITQVLTNTIDMGAHEYQPTPIITTITDTTPGGATNDGTIGGGEYVGGTLGTGDTFGDVIGTNSTLYIDSDTAGNLYFALDSVANFNDFIVIYIDSVSGGVTDTTGLEDTADNHRGAISGDNGGFQSEITFGSGFVPDYAITLDATVFAGLWQLTTGGPGSLTFVNPLTLTPTGNPAAGEWEFDGINLSDIGLTPGDSFKYIATYLNATNAFRSNEFQGIATNPSPAINIGQNPVTLPPVQYNEFVSAAPVADVFITEIMFDPASSEDNWEWVEVYNNGASAVNVSGWVIDDNNGAAHGGANIASGSIPAGSSAILYNADDTSAANFEAAWGTGINLIAVSNWGAMGLNNGGDQVSLWDSFSDYSGDNVAHANAIDTVNYGSAGFPGGNGAASIYLNSLAADNSLGVNWALSTDGGPTPLGTGYTSTSGGGNSGSDIGSPGGTFAPNLVISEILYNPDSVKPAWEWVEITNTGSAAADLTGYVFDDDDATPLTSANIAGGSVPPGGSAVLYNANVLTQADFEAAWGFGINLIAVDPWPAIDGSSTGSDRIGLWDSLTAYVSGVRDFNNALIDVFFESGVNGWPTNNDSASIYLDPLSADPNVGANWVLSTVSGSTPAGTGYQSANAGGNTGNDVGSPQGTFPTACSNTQFTIMQIQDAGHTSPELGNAVCTYGVVTAIASNGFYIQDDTGDADDDTSDGIFVFTSSAPPVTLAVNDLVKVEATVDEFLRSGNPDYLTSTQLVSPTQIQEQGTGIITPTLLGSGGRSIPNIIVDDDNFAVFDPASDGIDFYESLEGMLVQINNPLVTSYTNQFGDLYVLADGTGTILTDTGDGVILRDIPDYNPERIMLTPNLFPGNMPDAKPGDSITGTVTGIMDYDFGDYQFRALAAPVIVNSTFTPEVTTLNSGLRIAAYNVLNLDPDETDGSTDIADGQFVRLAEDIVNNLLAPDIIILPEIQDNSGSNDDSTVDASITLNTLITEIGNASGPTYQFININPLDGSVGGQPGGNIRVAMLYRTDTGLTFTPAGTPDATTPTTVNCTAGVPSLTLNPGLIDPNGAAFAGTRRVIVAEFEYFGNTFFVAGVHFSSKGGSSPIFGAVQPFDNGSESERIAQAAAVNAFMDDGTTNSILGCDPNANVVIGGDMNEFQFEDAMDELTASDTELVTLTNFVIPNNERYSYNFEGNYQALDHIVVSPNLFNVWGPDYEPVNVNVGEEEALQASDHDPVIANFTPVCFVEADADNVTDFASADHTAVQNAVNAAAPGSLLKIAGTCAGVSDQDADTDFETVLVTKDIILQGGYDPVTQNWLASSDPATYPTTLNGVNSGRVIYIETGGYNVLLDGLTVINGLAGGVVNTNGIVTVTNSDINNNAGDSSVGGGLSNPGGTMTIGNSIIHNNTAGFGAAVRTGGGGNLVIVNTSIYDNVAVNHAGGVYVNSPTFIHNSAIYNNSANSQGAAVRVGSGTTTISNTTIANNSTNVEGGGVRVSGTSSVLRLVNVTLSGNSSPNGANVRQASGSLVLYNTILDDPQLDDNCSGTIIDGGYNISSDASCAFASPTSMGDTDPQLDPAGLQNNGGLTQTIALTVSSPALDAGENGFIDEATIGFDFFGDGDTLDIITTDQRGTGFPRIINGTVDIGAFESDAIRCFAEYTGDNVTDFQSVDHTAVQDALNAASPASNVKVAGLCHGVSANSLADDETLEINKDITIVGGYDPASPNWTGTSNPTLYPTYLDGANSGRVVYIDSGHNVTLNGLTLRNGDTLNNGGGLYNDGSNVTLNNMVVANNNANFDGAGIYHTAGGNMTIQSSTIRNNLSNDDGGGLFSNTSTLAMYNTTFEGNAAVFGAGMWLDASTVLLVNNTFFNNMAGTVGGGVLADIGTLLEGVNLTFFGNSADSDGGGFYNLGANATLNNSTFSSNSAAANGSNVSHSNGTLTLRNSILDNPLGGGTNCVGTITDGNYNISSDGSCVFSASGSLDSTNPLLDGAGLQNNGGETQTVALQSTSPAIDLAQPWRCTYDNDLNPVTEAQRVYFDQTNKPRHQGRGCDAGAFEFAEPTITMNEIDVNQSATINGDNAEFIELYDGGTGNTAIDDMVIAFVDATAPQLYTALPSQTAFWTTDVDGYFVICVNASNVAAYCDFNMQRPNDWLRDGTNTLSMHPSTTVGPFQFSFPFPNGFDGYAYDTSGGVNPFTDLVIPEPFGQASENGDAGSLVDSIQRCSSGTAPIPYDNMVANNSPTPGLLNNCVFPFAPDDTPQPEAPALLSEVQPLAPVEHAVNTSMAFEWAYTDDAAQYHIWLISTEPQYITDWMMDAASVCADGVCRASLPADITLETGTYIWMVRAYNADMTQASNWSVDAIFTISDLTADIDTDGTVTPADVMYIINRQGSTDLTADIDGSGIIDDADVRAAMEQLGQTR